MRLAGNSRRAIRGHVQRDVPCFIRERANNIRPSTTHTRRSKSDQQIRSPPPSATPTYVHNNKLPPQTMAGSDMVHSSVPRPDDAGPSRPAEMRPNNEPDDDAIVLAPDQPSDS